MNANLHRAAKPQPKNLTAEARRTRRSSLGASRKAGLSVSNSPHSQENAQKILCRQERIFLRGIFALFAASR
ncbi:MAG: hypothetical protein DMG09_30380 [Acidobacteria bacterium]|nr:MAG: hypothetical protein DMG09_30380 [Acidobacteriota bacterium]